MSTRSQRLALLERKANEGAARAQYELGLAYYQGDGVEKDLEKARHWLSQAAAQGDRDATVLLSLRGLALNHGAEFRFGPKSRPQAPAAAQEEETYEIETKPQLSGDELLTGLREVIEQTQKLLPASEPMRERLIAVLSAMAMSVQTRRMPHRQMRDQITPSRRSLELTLQKYRGAAFDAYRTRLFALCDLFLNIELSPPMIPKPVKRNPAEDRFTRVGRLADQIEGELKALGWWRQEPPTAQQMDFKEAFGMDTMPLSMWIQFVLLPRVRQILQQRGGFPGQSMVGAHALREFDGQHEAANLVSLLCEFDEAVTRG